MYIHYFSLFIINKLNSFIWCLRTTVNDAHNTTKSKNTNPLNGVDDTRLLSPSQQISHKEISPWAFAAEIGKNRGKRDSLADFYKYFALWLLVEGFQNGRLLHCLSHITVCTAVQVNCVVKSWHRWHIYSCQNELKDKQKHLCYSNCLKLLFERINLVIK